MKVIILEIGDREKTDCQFLTKGDNHCALLLKYNIDELIELALKDKGKKVK